MKDTKFNYSILPVMFGFFIMGFMDVIGVATNYVKNDLTISDSVSSLISVSCFVWFLLLSIPTGMLMNRIGRKKTVVISFAVTAVAMIIPLLDYSFATILAAFALIGIGNTILQVALNPLVTNVVNGDKLTGTLTLGQFIKAISSFLGPILTAAFVGTFIGWKMVFPVYSAISLLAMIWLILSPIKEDLVEKSEISFGRTFSLFKDKYIVAFFIGILVLVGVDVGMGVTFPKILQERCGLALDKAGMGNSVYFLARTIGAFIGGIILMKFSEKKFYIGSVFVALVGLLGLIFAARLELILVFVAVFGLGYSNLFAIIFSLSMKREPKKANEVSALLIVGVAGGGIVTPILGLITDSFGTQTSALIALGIIWLYLLAIIAFVRKVKISEA